MVAEQDARLAGYILWEDHDPFEDYVGPMYYKRDENGEVRCAFVTQAKHMNGQNGLHGGMLMTFADYALFIFAEKALGEQRAVTVSFSSDFTAGVGEGEFVETTGEIVPETPGMLFLRGTVFCGDTVLLNYSAVLKKVRPKAG